jgi:FkbM family methyltransferase
VRWLTQALGIARSLVVYHGVPFRQRRLRRLYERLVPPGTVAFDCGAHVGNRVRALAAVGAHVVAVEPQPHFAKLLRVLFGRSRRVTIVEAGVAAGCGTSVLWMSDRTPTVTTLDAAWRDERAQEPGFAGVQWTRRIEIETRTLDRLIEQYGTPSFVKIDVEGAEADVLTGLSTPVSALSFEYLPQALDRVRAAVARLAALGTYRFNWSPGESYVLASRDWLTGDELLNALHQPAAQQKSGDVYVLHADHPLLRAPSTPSAC